MEAAWIGVAGVVIGAILTELVGTIRARRTFAWEKSWALFETRRSKYEQLYEICEQQRESYRQAHSKVFDALLSGSAPGDLGRLPSIPWARLAMLVSIYAPELAGSANRLHAACDRFGAVLGLWVIRRPQASTTAGDPVVTLMAEYQKLSDAYDEFVSQIAEQAAKLQGETISGLAPFRFRLPLVPR
jgi:hypothetical protein